MPHRRSVSPVVLLSSGFVVLTACVLSALWISVLQSDASRWVRHTLEVENRLNRVGRMVTDAEASQRGFLMTGQDSYLTSFRRASAGLAPELAALEASVRDNPAQHRSASALRAAMTARMERLDRGVALANAGRGADAMAMVRTGIGQEHMVQIRSVLGRMNAAEDRLLTERDAVARARTMIARGALVLSALLILLLAVTALRDTRRRITALTNANAQLRDEVLAKRQAQSQVRQLQKMEAVGQLTGGIAHDFNNMLAIIMGSLDLAKRRLNSPDRAAAARFIDQALEGAKNAAALTARLLAFARRQPLEPKVIDANKMVGGISEMLRRTLGEQVQVETVLAGGLWQVCADPDQIENALVNLSVNARDAMAEGGKLTIETANSELDERYAREHDEVSAGQYVMISVTDTGAGMSPEVIERAYEPFFTTKGVGQGTGLGLSQVFGFVKQSSGHLKIYSEIGRGTTVKIYLPRYTGTDAPLQRARTTEKMPLGSRDIVVLVVEDEPNVRRMSVEALSELGYAVIEASNGHEALEVLALHPHVDLMVTDIVMPGMTGRALADRVQAERPALKVLYTTGYTRNAIVHHGVVDYGVAFIQKPFTVVALARKVHEVLSSG